MPFIVEMRGGFSEREFPASVFAPHPHDTVSVILEPYSEKLISGESTLEASSLGRTRDEIV